MVGRRYPVGSPFYSRQRIRANEQRRDTQLDRNLRAALICFGLFLLTVVLFFWSN